LITSMDTSWDETGRWLTLLRDCLPFVDFFFCNIIEAQTMTGFSELNDISQALLDCGPETVVVKLGEHGSFIKRSELSLKVPTFPVQVVDTTGAGDCFVAAFLFGYLKGWDYERIARFANATGAICVTMPGATTAVQPATDIEGFLAKLKGT
jgi:sugar/nucleoside kinase (ribokinase family)